MKFQSITEYIASFPEDVQKRLEALRVIIHEEIPGVEEAIRYNLPTFLKDGKYIIYLSAWKKHISLYPYSSDMEHLFPEAKEYVTSGKGTIQFPYTKPLPIPFIRKIIKYRAVQ